ncbi:MAG: hypothetical protein J5746_04440 [Victivallales bacterium]|nr:hypothetical protein [Victivallales bacterium]
MPSDTEFLDVFPRIIPVGKKVRIRVRALFFQKQPSFLQKNGDTLLLKSFCDDKVLADGDIPHDKVTSDLLPYSIEDDCIVFDFTATREEEYGFALQTVSPEQVAKVQYVFKIYALEEDLFALRPFKGDLHVHGSWSQCGNRDEDPKYLLKTARKYGLDFFALTDHAQHEPSRILRQYAQELGTECNVLPGEECHSLIGRRATYFVNNDFYSPNHIVSIGAREGVCDYINAHFEEYQADLERRMAEMPATLGRTVREMCASADYIMDKIHEYGGTVIFAHPFWRTGDRCNLPAPVREHILKQGKYDAMEVIGLGQVSNRMNVLRMGNMEALALWQEESLKKGKLIPLVGSTDSHNAERLLGRQYTIAFAKANTTEGICQAVKEGNAVAFMDFENEVPYGFGPRRLLKYAYFLQEEYFPLHDEMCRTEAGLIAEEYSGRCKPGTVKAICQGKQEALFARYFMR